MYETPLLEILVPLLTVGIPITMISSFIFLEMPSKTVDGDQHLRVASAEGFQKREDLFVRDDVDESRGMIALSGYVPAVYLVSTSWASSIPHAANEQDVLGHDPAHLVGPPAAQRPEATGLKRTEIGCRGEMTVSEHVGNAC